MIKIGPLLTNEFKQAAALLRLQEELGIQEAGVINDGELVLRSLAFWQHWLPCQMHMAPSIYVAREDGHVIGVIALHHTSKSRGSWQIDKLVVHPDHRGRGIAQELLRFVFAQFGSQGVMHFLAEVPALNEAALTLFANCGFCRSSRISFYRYNPNHQHAHDKLTEGFKVALPHNKASVYQLYSEVLPPALRQVLLLSPEDFEIKETIPFTSVEKTKQKLMRTRVWYWIQEDTERMVFTAATKVTADPEFGYRLEFAVHPGWKDQAEDLLRFTMTKLLSEVPKAQIWAKVYEFQGEVLDLMPSFGFERTGEAFVLLREHWQRSRQPRRAKIPHLNPVINFPLAADRNVYTGAETDSPNPFN